MRIWLKMFGMPVVSIVALSVISVANAAESGRAAYNVNRLNRAESMGAAQRMPTMPTLPINTTGNMTEDLPTDVPMPIVPDKPDTPDTPDVPDKPKPECPDGGVKNSEYTVEKCMNDVYSCVNQSLPGGINDLFNEELRNSIVNGMGLCSIQVEKCVTQVRRDCENIYHSAADVWLDFNARKVQPDYYAFVLRKTGLTPLQAENTCWLLDKNTYGASFDAVANSGITTYEYNNRVGAYNGQGGVNIVKKNPQGATLNNGNPGVDGSRGHYARWDATTAECYLRVAAYNKDTPIKNSWLFGAIGDDRLAEAWERAGATFTCNKDLFGFSLYKNTNTVAVVGIGGGTLLGAGIGALAGHGNRAFDCENKGNRENLLKSLGSDKNISVLNQYLDNDINLSDKELSVAQCQEIVSLYEAYNQLTVAVSNCKTTRGKKIETVINADVTISCSVRDDSGTRTLGVNEISQLNDVDRLECYKTLNDSILSTADIKAACYPSGIALPLNVCIENWNAKLREYGRGIAADQLKKLGYTVTHDGYAVANGCLFKPLNKDLMNGDGIYCDGVNSCLSAADITEDLKRLSFFDGAKLDGDKNNRLKTTLIGAGIGAGTGGVATAITAFVEKNNINCRVGDGLERVSYGKSMAIGTLRDFYVKWNLRLPETVAPTAHVVDCNSWHRACSEITDLNQCKRAQVNYKPAGAPAITLVHAACIPSGSVCIENYPVAKSYGACVPESKPDDDKGTRE